MMRSSNLVAYHSILDQQVQWQHPKIVQSGVDQTQVVIADAPTEAVPFSFVVMGDTDAGAEAGASADGGTPTFSATFAQQLIAQLGGSRFLLHTGDVTYPVGTYQNYLSGFLQPYQTLLSALPESPAYKGDEITFERPLLPVPGNHDYADQMSGFRSWDCFMRFVCDRLRRIGIDWGHYGGQGGEAYGQTFLDDLATLTPEQLSAHLRDHYSAGVDNAVVDNAVVNNATLDSDRDFRYGLNYRAGKFTRLPNRYYRFRYGGIDFFALDSNTWNMDATAKGFDHGQLAWLENALVESWQSPEVVGRIVYLHHSPYTTESTRWQQSETLWTRRHLRSVLDKVAVVVDRVVVDRPHDFVDSDHTPPLVDLVISGHAHCLEHVRTMDTGHADSHLDWLVCGGSGASLRRQWNADADILENLSRQGRSVTGVVAKSQLYAGVHGRGNKKQQFHSFVRVEVQPHQPKKLRVCPYVVVCDRKGWRTKALTAWSLGGTHANQASVA